ASSWIVCGTIGGFFHASSASSQAQAFVRDTAATCGFFQELPPPDNTGEYQARFAHRLNRCGRRGTRCGPVRATADPVRTADAPAIASCWQQFATVFTCDDHE